MPLGRPHCAESERRVCADGETSLVPSIASTYDARCAPQHNTAVRGFKSKLWRQQYRGRCAPLSVGSARVRVAHARLSRLSSAVARTQDRQPKQDHSHIHLVGVLLAHDLIIARWLVREGRCRRRLIVDGGVAGRWCRWRRSATPAHAGPASLRRLRWAVRCGVATRRPEPGHQQKGARFV
eukprot:7253753-Prymnesium_polylepis.1